MQFELKTLFAANLCIWQTIVKWVKGPILRVGAVKLLSHHKVMIVSLKTMKNQPKFITNSVTQMQEAEEND